MRLNRSKGRKPIYLKKKARQIRKQIIITKFSGIENIFKIKYLKTSIHQANY